MRALLDTHTLIWAVDAPSKLSSLAANTLKDPGNELLLSAVSFWEIAIKFSMKKLTLTLRYLDWVDQATIVLALHILPVTAQHADGQTTLSWHHKDPFDRFLIEVESKGCAEMWTLIQHPIIKVAL